jgi:anhydro-N-acetylmuramic acid kinase
MASQRPTAFVGLMSGTSLDGVTAVVARFVDRAGRDPRHGVELLAHVQHPYSDTQRKQLRAAMREGSAREYCRTGFDLGGWLADAAVEAISKSGLDRGEIRAIGSHGHTIWHEPPHSTWQLGETAVIAERTGLDTVGDFRVADVAAGGQGAPLVPIADALLFSADAGWRALQNIGGIGNVTVVPPGGKLDGVRAFDTGPGAAVTDGVVEALFPGKTFDRDGHLAAKGKPVNEVVDALLAHPYFAAPPPKSTGRELFDPAYVRDLIDRCRAARRGASSEDIVATAVELTARSIADAYRRFLPEPWVDVLPSGGGARHPVLIERLRALLAPRTVRRFDEAFFDGEAKEAVAFALLAKLALDGMPGNVPGATGARGPRVLGKVQRAGGANEVQFRRGS